MKRSEAIINVLPTGCGVQDGRYLGRKRVAARQMAIAFSRLV